jgi:hypothetical protein
MIRLSAVLIFGLIFAVAVVTKSRSSERVPPRPAAALGGADFVFGDPTSTPPITGCGYRADTCARAGRYHTGIDYQRLPSGPTTVVASNYGTIARLEFMGPSDQGMGTNVIVEHELESGEKVYSSYSHLASVAEGLKEGDTVAKGQALGIMGGSGYGQSNYWGVHLHFELKDRPVTHSPSGNGTFWGYTPSNPDEYGYHDPGAYIGVVSVKAPPPPAPVVTVTLTAPNGGTLGRGRRVTVKWSTAGADPGDEVSIYFKRDSFASLEFPDGVNFVRLTESERNDGSYKGTIPIAIALARDWRFYVKHNASGVSDASDFPVRIKR